MCVDNILYLFNVHFYFFHLLDQSKFNITINDAKKLSKSNTPMCICWYIYIYMHGHWNDV